MSFVSFIEGMASTAGWSKLRVLSETLVSLPFNSNEGGVEVFITPCGKYQGKTVIEFSSIGIPVPEDPAIKFAIMEALLIRNGKLALGHWAIVEGETENRFTVMMTQIAETMDPPEFESAVTVVGMEFDKMIGLLRKMTQKARIDF